MLMYVFDDKTAEIAKAKEAIVTAGHEIGCLPEHTGTAPKLASSTDNLRQIHSSGLFLEIVLAVKKMAKEGGGIITDLMFQNGPYPSQAIPPAGLLIVIQALSAGVPVVVCTDAKEVGGHHAEAISWIFDGYISNFRWFSAAECPFGWIEDKDWGRAVAMLAEMRAKTTAQSPSSVSNG